MYQKISLLLLFALCGVLAPLSAQVVVKSQLTPTTIRVGEQADLSVSVTLGAGERAYFPEYKNGGQIAPGVEVVEASPVDTTYLNENRRVRLTRTYRLTSFDQALYTLPAFAVKVGGKTYKASAPLGLKVDTAGISVDTLHVDRFYGPKGAVEGVFTWRSLYFWLAALVLVLLVAAAVLTVRYFNRRPITRRVVVRPPEAPHKWAIREINKIKEERNWNEDDAKDYYVRLTDVLRRYIEQRFHFGAREMTSSEILDKLLKAKDEASLRELRQVLETADLVKFAKYKAALSENDANLVKAVEFINETRVEAELPPDPIVKEVVLKENKQMALRIAMAVGALVLAVAAVGLVVYLFGELRQSFF